MITSHSFRVQEKLNIALKKNECLTEVLKIYKYVNMKLGSFYFNLQYNILKSC